MSKSGSLSDGNYTIESASGDHKGFFLTVKDGDIVLDNKASGIWYYGYLEETSVATFTGVSPEMPKGKLISVGDHAMLVYDDSRPTSATAFHLESTTDGKNIFRVTIKYRSTKMYWTPQSDCKISVRPKTGKELPKWKFSKCD